MPWRNVSNPWAQPHPVTLCLRASRHRLCPPVDRSGSDKNRKLDDCDEAQRIEGVSLDMRIKIQQARLAKKMTQVAQSLWTAHFPQIDC